MLTHPRTERAEHRPAITRSWCLDRRRYDTLFSQKPDVHGHSRQGPTTNPALIACVRLAFDVRVASLECGKHVVHHEPGRTHPIRPAGQRIQHVPDGRPSIPPAVKPISEVVDVLSGRTCAEPLTSNG